MTKFIIWIREQNVDWIGLTCKMVFRSEGSRSEQFTSESLNDIWVPDIAWFTLIIWLGSSFTVTWYWSPVVLWTNTGESDKEFDSKGRTLTMETQAYFTYSCMTFAQVRAEEFGIYVVIVTLWLVLVDSGHIVNQINWFFFHNGMTQHCEAFHIVLDERHKD